jgi:hypothetical protein
MVSFAEDATRACTEHLPFPQSFTTILRASRPVWTLAGNVFMSKSKARNEVTSARAATAASKVLRDPRSTKAEKTAAASALTQRPGSATKKR